MYTMNRSLLLLTFTTLIGLAASAQAYEGTIEYNKKKQQAFVIDYGYTAEAVEAAISQKIGKGGYEGRTEKGLFNKNKGFIVFRRTVIPEIDQQSRDYAVKVEQKSRKETDQTTLYVIPLQDEVSVVSTMNSDLVARAKSFLNNLSPDIEDAKLEIEIRGEEDGVAKAEKKFKELQDEKGQLEKKLQKNTEEIEKQQLMIENQRRDLDLLRGKRRGATPSGQGDKPKS